MGKNITLVGGNGDGQTCEVANQIIVALNVEAVAEALLFASKAGAEVIGPKPQAIQEPEPENARSSMASASHQRSGASRSTSRA